MIYSFDIIKTVLHRIERDKKIIWILVKEMLANRDWKYHVPQQTYLEQNRVYIAAIGIASSD